MGSWTMEGRVCWYQVGPIVPAEVGSQLEERGMVLLVNNVRTA
jgi:hypothetical protein